MSLFTLLALFFIIFLFYGWVSYSPTGDRCDGRGGDPSSFSIRRLYALLKNKVFGGNNKSEEDRRKPKSSYDSDLVVVLDLDECLIHTCTAAENVVVNPINPPLGGKEEEEDADDVVERFVCKFPTIGQHRKIVLRPGVIQFLQTIMGRYETYVYTAGCSDYANPIITELEKRVGEQFAGCLFRESCTEKLYMKIPFLSKNLQNIRREMDRIILIDDDPTNFENNPDNGIPIRSFRGNKNDTSLKKVASLILQELDDAKVDVRTILRPRFKMAKLFEVSKEIFQPLHLQWEHVYKCAQLVQL